MGNGGGALSGRGVIDADNEIEEGRLAGSGVWEGVCWPWRSSLRAAFFLQMKLAGGSTKTEPYEEYTVGTMTLRAMVTSSGVAVAQDEAVLSFSGAGQLNEVLVNLGDTVHEGQPLMRLKSDDLENAAATAASALRWRGWNYRRSKRRLRPPTSADADRAVATARAALTKAQNDLKDALDPGNRCRR